LEFMQLLQEPPIKRLHYCGMDKMFVAQQLEATGRFARFAFDQRPASAIDQVQRLQEQRHSSSFELGTEPASSIERLDLLRGPGSDFDPFAAPACYGVGGSVQVRIVDHDRHAVAAVAVVQLNEICASAKSVIDGWKRVLGCESATAAV